MEEQDQIQALAICDDFDFVLRNEEVEISIVIKTIENIDNQMNVKSTDTVLSLQERAVNELGLRVIEAVIFRGTVLLPFQTMAEVGLSSGQFIVCLEEALQKPPGYLEVDSSLWRCRSCDVNNVSEVLRCEVCQTVNPKKVLIKKRRCPMGHELKKFTTSNATFHCHACATGSKPPRKFPSGTIMYGCRSCGWDVCRKCLPAVHEEPNQAPSSSLRSQKIPEFCCKLCAVTVASQKELDLHNESKGHVARIARLNNRPDSKPSKPNKKSKAQEAFKAQVLAALDDTDSGAVLAILAALHEKNIGPKTAERKLQKLLEPFPYLFDMIGALFVKVKKPAVTESKLDTSEQKLVSHDLLEISGLDGDKATCPVL